MSRDEEQDLAERIRLRAYRLWEQEGRPEGREGVHWDQASELVAIEDNYRLTTRPVPSSDDLGPTGEPIEPGEIIENLGEFPTLTDQGEEQTFPERQAAPKAVPSPTKGSEAGAKRRQAKSPTMEVRAPATSGRKKRAREARGDEARI